MPKQKIIFFLAFFFGLFLPISYVWAGTVLSAHKYAWSNNVGYINFENVVVDDATLSGYAWSTNKGFIKFNPAQGGVLNNGNGDLSGSAWGEQLGWIDFSGVSINSSTGKFSGSATGTLVGTITFDCGYCDVQTNWGQPSSSAVSVSGSVSGGGGGGSSPTQTSTTGQGSQSTGHINVRNQTLTISSSGQSGTLTIDTPAGPVILQVAANTQPGKATFSIATAALATGNQHLISGTATLINGVFYDISAHDANGNRLTSFTPPITITLPLPANLRGAQNLAVYWFNETNQQWALIPDAVFGKTGVTFQVNHLSRFAIFTVPPAAAKGLQKPEPLQSISIGKPSTVIDKTTQSSAAQNIAAPEQPKKSIFQRVKSFFGSIILKILKFFW